MTTGRTGTGKDAVGEVCVANGSRCSGIWDLWLLGIGFLSPLRFCNKTVSNLEQCVKLRDSECISF